MGGERRSYEDENTETVVNGVEVDENTASRVRTFDKLVRRSLKTEDDARAIRMERGQSNMGRVVSRSLNFGESNENLTKEPARELGNSTKKTTAKTTVHTPSNKIEHSFVQCCCGKADPTKKFQPSNKLEHGFVRCLCGGGDKKISAIEQTGACTCPTLLWRVPFWRKNYAI